MRNEQTVWLKILTFLPQSLMNMQYISNFCIVVTKMPKRDKPKEEEVILAQSLRVQCLSWREDMAAGARGSWSCRVLGYEVMSAGASVSQVMQTRTPAHRTVVSSVNVESFYLY